MSTEATGAAAPGTTTHDNRHHHHQHHDVVDLHVHDNDNDHSTIAVGNTSPVNKSPKHTGLHSPPDSNNVDATDSELSDLDEAIADADSPSATTAPGSLTAPKANNAHESDNDDDDDNVTARADEPEQNGPEQVPTPRQDEDIGEVVPDHWSGTVPVFKPNMHQFKDFKKFVCHPTPTFCCQVAGSQLRILTYSCTDGSCRLLRYEVRHHQDYPSSGMEGLAP